MSDASVTTAPPEGPTLDHPLPRAIREELLKMASAIRLVEGDFWQSGAAAKCLQRASDLRGLFGALDLLQDTWSKNRSANRGAATVIWFKVMSRVEKLTAAAVGLSPEDPAGETAPAETNWLDVLAAGVETEAKKEAEKAAWKRLDNAAAPGVHVYRHFGSAAAWSWLVSLPKDIQSVIHRIAIEERGGFRPSGVSAPPDASDMDRWLDYAWEALRDHSVEDIRRAVTDGERAALPDETETPVGEEKREQWEEEDWKAARSEARKALNAANRALSRATIRRGEVYMKEGAPEGGERVEERLASAGAALEEVRSELHNYQSPGLTTERLQELAETCRNIAAGADQSFVRKDK